MASWIFNILVSFDQTANTLLGGDPDETISSRAGKAYREGKPWARALCRLLHFFDKGHCEKSIEPDEGSNAVVKD